MFRKIQKTIMIVSVCFYLSLGLAKAEDPILITSFNYPPFSIITESKTLKGIGPDIVKEMTKRLNLKTTEQASGTKRSLFTLESQSSILPVLTRTKKREEKYHWIGPVLSDTNCFTTLKNNGPLKSMEAAKALRKIGVNAGGSTFRVLDNAGFKNLDPVTNNNLNLKKLFANRVDAWFSSEVIALYTANEIGLDGDQIICTPAVRELNYYIVASKKMPLDLVEKLKKVYKELEKEGTIKKIQTSYLKFLK